MDQFEHIRPYNNSEIPAAIKRVANHPLFNNIIDFLIPKDKQEIFKNTFLNITNTKDFQEIIMFQAINSILAKSSTSFDVKGFEQLSREQSYMFIANHRDILLDAALLQICLNRYGLDTSEITFGSNLMQNGLVIDIGKMNKMFRIERGGTVHDFYRSSTEVSSYMRNDLLGKHQSVWIAQRNGRTKDGNDRTEMAVLKMFSLSSDKDFVENMAELNITPIVTSYEFEPCDFLKTQELYVSQYQKYIKESGEDVNSILQGITQKKGGICVCATPTISRKELEFCNEYEKNGKFHHLAKIIDNRIFHHYKLWNTNYMAYDLVEKSYRFADHYNNDEMKDFQAYMNDGLAALQGDNEELRQIFLNIYANPVRNIELQLQNT